MQLRETLLGCLGVGGAEVAVEDGEDVAVAGAAVGLVAVSDVSPILDVECRTYGEYAGDMTMSVDPPRKWWQGVGALSHDATALSFDCGT